MKTIDELGISPAPWSADDWIEAEHGEYDVRIRDANDNEIAQPLSTFDDARLIAAAPELYEALMEIVCDMCGHCYFRGECERGEDGMSTHCNQYLKAKDALAKASGKEAVK